MKNKAELQMITSENPSSKLELSKLVQNTYGVTDVRKAIKTKSMSLVSLKKDQGYKVLKATLKIYFKNMNDMLGLKLENQLSNNQVEFLVNQLSNEFYYLKLVDLGVIFNKIVGGESDDFKYSITPPKIMSVVRKYVNQKQELARQL
tara:strand:+ start:6898 stop:7338 length:441 start_codon:yes stop_codon:yes gene_type:complete